MKRETRKLLKQAAEQAEKAFRRGFHHGVIAGNGSTGNVPTEAQVSDWRYRTPINKTISPPWRGAEDCTKAHLLKIAGSSINKHLQNEGAESPLSDITYEYLNK